MLQIDRRNKLINDIYVCKIPGWIQRIWFFKQIAGIPLKNTFWLKKEIYNSIFSNNPDVYSMGIAIHEIEHLRRAKDMGVLKYHTLYRINSQFRYNEELECHKPQFKYYQKMNFDFNLKNRSKILSGKLYFWPVSENKALEDLNKIWSESNKEELSN